MLNQLDNKIYCSVRPKSGRYKEYKRALDRVRDRDTYMAV